MRERLPQRRECSTSEFAHNGFHFTLSVGRFEDERPAELFISSKKVGTPIEAIARDAAIVTSLALQHHVDPETIRKALTKGHNGTPATLLGAALDELIAHELENLLLDG